MNMLIHHLSHFFLQIVSTPCGYELLSFFSNKCPCNFLLLEADHSFYGFRGVAILISVVLVYGFQIILSSSIGLLLRKP